MDPVGLTALREAIWRLHHRASHWVESVPVRETWQDRTVWQGEVQVFDLVPDAPAPRCYAWSYPGTDGKPQIVTVLHSGIVDSPAKAVQQFLVRKVRQAEKS
jgi:hypothetical protein